MTRRASPPLAIGLQASGCRFSNGTLRMAEPAWLSAKNRSTLVARSITSLETFGRSDSLTRPTFPNLVDKFRIHQPCRSPSG